MNMFDLLKMLAEAKVEFVLVGGLAVALRGYLRVTMDVDVVVAMDEENLQRFMSAAKASGLRPTIPVPIESRTQPELIEQWCRENGMLAFSLRGAEMMATVLDVLIRPVVPFADLRRDAAMIEVGALGIPVASVDIEELQKLRARK